LSKKRESLFIEFGSSKIRAAVLSYSDDGTPNLELAQIKSQGFLRGEVTDEFVAANALDNLLINLEKQGFGSFESCTLLIPGSLTTSYLVSTKTRLNGVSVTKEHESLILSDLTSQVGDPSNDPVDLAISSWGCGTYSGLDVPLGKSGEYLEASGLCVFADRKILAKIVSLCNLCGLKVERTLSSLLATGNLIKKLLPDSANRVVIDIGHSTTVGMISVGRRPNSTFSIKAGSHHMTRDLCAGMGCPLEAAEVFKHQIGLGAPSDSTSPVVYHWLAPRVSEIVSLCLRHFAIYVKALDGGIVFVGGGSQIKELTSFVSTKLPGINVTRFKPCNDALAHALGLRIKQPDDVSLSGFEALIESASHEHTQNQSSQARAQAKTPSFLRPLVKWFSEIST
jgi:cell division ATPase FtsA